MADMEHNLILDNTLMLVLRLHHLNRDQTMGNRRTDTILRGHKWVVMQDMNNSQIKAILVMDLNLNKDNAIYLTLYLFNYNFILNIRFHFLVI